MISNITCSRRCRFKTGIINSNVILQPLLYNQLIKKICFNQKFFGVVRSLWKINFLPYNVINYCIFGIKNNDVNKL